MSWLNVNDDPGERARVYLGFARRCADLVNKAYLPTVEQTAGVNREWVVSLAAMNALMAIAEAAVPPPPRSDDLRG